MTARSYLFVPGDRSDMLEKAAGRGADAIIADLEDAVAPAERSAARKGVAAWLAGLDAASPEAWVRVSSSTERRDVELAALPSLTGLMIPKVEVADEIYDLSARLDRMEQKEGLPPGKVRLLPIVETAKAMRHVNALATAPRVHQLMIGELDLGAELGIDPGDAEMFAPLRMAVVVASVAAGISAPLGPVSPNYRNLEGFEAGTRVLARQGFAARPAIHPAQIPVINGVFTPAPREVERARRLVAEYEAAIAEGRGAIADEDGHMVDEAVVRAARRLIHRAGEAGS
jgi:citrate lyase subunit beta/citryl-CoA lyase